MAGTHPDSNSFFIAGKTVPQLSAVIIAQVAWMVEYSEPAQHAELIDISIDQAHFVCDDERVIVGQHEDGISAKCTCPVKGDKLCLHGAAALMKLHDNAAYSIFFDAKARMLRLKKAAADYGIFKDEQLDDHFTIELADGRLTIRPKDRSLLPVTAASLSALSQQLMLDTAQAAPKGHDETSKRIIVLRQHKFYKHLLVELYDAETTKDGRIKNPLTTAEPLQLMLDTNDPFELKFYTAVSRHQQNIDARPDKQGLEGLKAIVRNPLNLDIYLHDPSVSEKASPAALNKISLRLIHNDTQLTVDQLDEVYSITSRLRIGEDHYPLAQLQTLFGYFIRLNDTLYLAKSMQMIGVINLFKGKESLHIHPSQFSDFRTGVLNKLGTGVMVRYPYIPEATPQQIREQRFDQNERIIFLSDFGQYIMIFPVMRYGEAEIPVRNNELIYAVDAEGSEFLVQRNEPAEQEFIAAILRQHPFFEEQLSDQLQYFYLHKRRFMDENWFLDAFEAWRKEGITILGFNELPGNRLNPEKVTVTIRVLSGLNWFNTKIVAKFGKRKASLKHLHKAIRNKTKYVELDDGTLGILPQEWIDKFSQYFKAGQVVDDELLTAKSNFQILTELYEEHLLDEEVRLEIQGYHKKFENLDKVRDIDAPASLKGILRPYQKVGLNWLNLLDELNFGGCLADDMGLGKTIQVLAFILSQNDKARQNTNLVVVPTSLIFNWQAEVRQFAPTLKVLTQHGPDRAKDTSGFNNYHIVLTTYGTLLSDVRFLRHYTFNYVFLDESQNIKNPGSQRYKAARLLQARNRIAITGTPFENNTFDIYGQLSFTNPGLLGSLLYFKEIYAMPIDQFHDRRRAADLQRRIGPFILRRTKAQVAAELPDKTEMVLYCPMGEEQRSMYNAYEKEFRDFVSATSQDELKKSSMHVLKGITKLRQLCNSPHLLEGVRLPGSASSKIEALAEQIESKAPYHKILVFSQFVGMLNLIRDELKVRHINYAYLTGATKDREKVVNDFQQNDATRVFLISLKAGGTGLNLTAADYVFLVDPWWNPAIEQQAIDRAYRIGQHKNVMAVRLICPDTIEEKVVKLQQTKKELAGKLVTPDAVLSTLSKQDWLDLLKPLY